MAIHYVACHRNEIPQEILERILTLPYEAQEPSPEELNYIEPDHKFYDYFEGIKKEQ